MNGGLHVDPAQMETLGNRTMNSASDLDGQIKSLTGNKDSLMSIWRGDASAAFDQSVQAQLKNLDAFKELINELGTRITKGAGTFHTNEEENKKAANDLYDDEY